MRTLRNGTPSLLVVTILCFLTELVSTNAPADEPAKAKFEIRKVELKPAEGLTPFTKPGYKETFYLHPMSEMTGADVAEAKIRRDLAKFGIVIEFTFTDAGTKKMESLTEKHVDKPIAFVLDGKVLSAPYVRQKISAKAAITGDYTEEEAERIVKSLGSK
jgi:preprotein translocase subunit SecD